MKFDIKGYAAEVLRCFEIASSTCGYTHEEISEAYKKGSVLRSKVKDTMVAYIASEGKTVIDDIPFDWPDIRIFAGVEGICDRMYYFTCHWDYQVDISVHRYVQENKHDEGYISDEIITESRRLSYYLQDCYGS